MPIFISLSEHLKENDVVIDLYRQNWIFDSISSENICRQLEKLINECYQNPEIKLGEIDIITAEEKHRILNEFNNTAADYPRDKTIHELFEDRLKGLRII